MATFPILSKAYFAKVPFDSARTGAAARLRPLQGGPGRAPGRRSNMQRVADYWGRDLPVNRGIYNFDRLRIEFYGDRQAGVRGVQERRGPLPRGGHLAPLGDRPTISRRLNAGKVVKREFPSEKRPAMQAIAAQPAARALPRRRA